MPTKPGTTYTWSTDTLYTGGPDVGTPTKAAPSAGLQAQGYRPGDEPGGQNFNELFSNFTLWTIFVNLLFDSTGRLLADLTDVVAHRFPVILFRNGTGWASTPDDTAPGLRLECTTSDTCWVDLPLDESRHLKRVTLSAFGNGADDLTWSVRQGTKSGSTSVIGTQVILNQAAAWSDIAMRFDAHTTTGISMTYNGATHIYSRASGDFLAEGFYVGASVTIAGFSTGGINGTYTITALTATTMTTSNVFGTGEGPTTVSVTAADAGLTVDDTFDLHLELVGAISGSAPHLAVKNLRYAHNLP